MINFLRKIRRKLIDERNLKSYLIYAIGEIFLVVIGILIALQINYWNENRKDRELEKYLLNNLVENIEQNCGRLEWQIKTIANHRIHSGVIISAIENKTSYHDSIDNYFHVGFMNSSHLRLSSVGYEAIKNVGLEIITNEMLKKEMMIFFEETQPIFHVELEWGDMDMADREKFIDEHFIRRPKYKDKRGRPIYKPFDANKLFLDRYFIGLIYKIDLQRRFFSFQMKDHLKESQKLLKNVKEELKE